MHARKTGALIRAAGVAGAIMAGASMTLIEAIDRYAAALGLAFQIVDDMLDVEGAADRARQDGGKGRGRRQAHLPGALRTRRVAPPGARAPNAPNTRSPAPDVSDRLVFSLSTGSARAGTEIRERLACRKHASTSSSSIAVWRHRASAPAR